MFVKVRHGPECLRFRNEDLVPRVHVIHEEDGRVVEGRHALVQPARCCFGLVVRMVWWMSEQWET